MQVNSAQTSLIERMIMCLVTKRMHNYTVQVCRQEGFHVAQKPPFAWKGAGLSAFELLGSSKAC